MFMSCIKTIQTRLTIGFEIPKYSEVRIIVYDILGRQRDIVIDGIYQAGKYEIKFDGSNLVNGIYFYKIQSGDFVSVKRMLLIK